MTFKELENIKKQTKESLQEWKNVAARIVSSKGYWGLIQHHATEEDRAYIENVVSCLDKHWLAASTALVSLLDAKIEKTTQAVDDLRGQAVTVGQLAMEHLREIDTFIQKYHGNPPLEQYRCTHMNLVESAEKTLDAVENLGNIEGH